MNAHPHSASSSNGPRDRLRAVVELTAVLALVLGANVFEAVPVTETPWLILLGWWSLRRRGKGWKAVGFSRENLRWPIVALGLLAGMGLQILDWALVSPIVERLTGSRPDLSSFANLVGNLPATLVMLALVWTLAAFGEELGYRGYVLERAASLGGYSNAAYVLAVILISVLFGLGHVYQGAAGIASSAVSGLYFGALYLASGRNLWLPIFAHGFSNTIALVLIYLGLVSLR